MSKLALGLLVLGIAATPFVEKDVPVAKPVLAYDTTGSITPLANSQIVYVVRSTNGATCRVVSENKGLIKPDSACAQVHEGLENVTNRVAGDQGNDLLKDASGKTIMVLGPSDGFAFEAVKEDGTQISFSLSDV
jgi:hypothetical protein